MKKFLQDYITNSGKPKVILSDHGLPQFTSGIWKEILGWEGIITKHTIVYHPQSNQVEQIMKVVGFFGHTATREQCVAIMDK